MTNAGRAFVRADIVLVFLAMALIFPAEVSAGQNSPAAPVLAPTILRTIPHDPGAFTQGLLFADGLLYESTGGYGRSSLRRIDPESGRILDMVELPESLFGEGIAMAGTELIQLTWKRGLALVWRAADLSRARVLRYPGQGWGLAETPYGLAMSDGSDRILLRDPETFAPVRALRVRDRGKNVARLNELEWIKGRLWANVWKEERIAVLSLEKDPGRVEAWIDLSGLVPDGLSPESVPNGVAYDPEQDRIFITGKNWPKIFEISLPGP